MEYRIEASAALSAPAKRGNRSHVQLSAGGFYRPVGGCYPDYSWSTQASELDCCTEHCDESLQLFWRPWCPESVTVALGECRTAAADSSDLQLRGLSVEKPT